MILWVVIFCFAQLTLTYFFPRAGEEWEVWQKYYIAKDATYDFLFVITSWLVFSLAEGKPRLKAVAAFALIMTAGSFIDKVIFSLNQYLWSDVLLIGLGLLASWRVYKAEYGRHKKLGG
jgi:hypothetical protein